MAEDELHVVGLRELFYRDSFGKVITIIIGILLCIGLLIAASVYIYLQKPVPVTFPVDPEFRVQADIPVSQPYQTTPDLLQWVSDTMLKLFVFDFNYYNEQLEKITPYFTENGWKVFLNQLNIYANYNTVRTDKLFITGLPTGAPEVLNRGVVSGRYTWQVQIPVEISYVSFNRTSTQQIVFQLTIVRVPTLNNLTGVAIDDVIVDKNTEDKL